MNLIVCFKGYRRLVVCVCSTEGAKKGGGSREKHEKGLFLIVEKKVLPGALISLYND